MNIEQLDKVQLKQILKTSQGFPTQWVKSKAIKKSGAVSPSRSGHAISKHVRGATSIQYKTKFCSLNDMVEALWLVLNTPAGITALGNLRPGSRTEVPGTVNAIYDIAAHVDKIGEVKFTKTDQRKIGKSKTSCFALLEGRSRGQRIHLHVQTFYPRLADDEIFRLLDAKTSP